ncbi:hypothetical protein CKO42_06035 [Lamprobacter modestohalophilus]|uniref:DNA 3'-5' helicase II n=1 Tax=Lamprobacter modestohalophilus TaxID=1064514 RepID=A0A9X1B339_9GAMM|nr:ATP-binding domain-containing protein [Lamprobacter modestohalophilus]MBK1618015.1 hypothetical protein [Lamprobacter modestohalophilus]
MAARNWTLPDIQNLSKEQERARLLPREGCHLIVGGPGTGKSVLALLRTRRHHRERGAQDYVFLVYNRLLLEASRELVGGAVNAHPWISWFRAMFKRALAKQASSQQASSQQARSKPALSGFYAQVAGQGYRLDWTAIHDAIASAVELPAPLTPFVIIDEGQDMPRDFYQALAQLGFEHVYVVADQNQQITDECSTLSEIATALDIDARDRIELTENYRNCDRIARLALAFCVEDLASPCVKLPSARPCARAPILVDYGAGCRWSAEQLIMRMLKLADRDPAKLIGIITPNNQRREYWFQALRQPRHDLHLDHRPPRVLTYASGLEDGDHRFSEGGLFVINAQSAKGLEFDIVFLADIHEYPCQLENKAWMDDLRRRFYVMVSRAREQVILLRQAGQECPIEAILPNDPDILRRWR